IEDSDSHPVTLSPGHLVIGTPRDVLAQIDLVPPLVALGKALGWSPLPPTIKEGRGFARAEDRRPGIEDRRLKIEDSRSQTDDRPSSILYPPSSMVGGQPSVVLSHVHFSYGEDEALYDLSLTARPGEILALMGRNGSGKTTMLKLIVGLLKPQRG